MSRVRRRTSILARIGGYVRAHHIGLIALFIALGGTSYAAIRLPANSVGTKQLKKNAVTLEKIKRSTRKALKGQKGDKGDTGQSGAKGATGAPGASSFAVNCNEGLAANDVMVRVGPFCIDRYEASIWTARTGGTQIIGAIPCSANGQDCKGKIFARSVAGVTPRADVTWFQAQQALANSGKRLPSNAEWQMAVAGTPDSTACNVSTGAVQSTGANAGCISNHGTSDMVGNLYEWVADWDEQADACGAWTAGTFGDDRTCFGDGTPSRLPAALLRGGTFVSDVFAGPFAVDATIQPSASNNLIGFRGAR